MARYIDAEKLCKALRDMAFYQNPYKQSTILGVVESIEQFPTADVAPRAEVAREISVEIEEEIVAALESNYRTLKEWDDGRCNDYILEMVNRIKGKIDALRGIERFVEELKKKYTEECHGTKY